MRITIEITDGVDDARHDTLEMPNPRIGSGYDPCAACPNNPKNGGSGICACSLPHTHGPWRVIA